MRCLVTGATGCLGMNLTKRLVQEGHEVIALGRNQQLGGELAARHAHFVSLDLQDGYSLKRIAKHSEVIFHCAALSSPWGKYNDFYQANVLGTQHVLDAVPEHARLIHVSSPSIYFDFTEKHQIKEHDPLPKKPVNHYVKTKLMAEALVDKAFVERNRAVITLRPRAIFGPYDRSIIPRLLQAERKGVVPIVGDGTNLIDVTYVDNVVESLLLAAQAKEQYLGRKYNITNDESRPLNEIISLLFNALGREVRYKYVSLNVAKNIARCLEVLYRFGTKEPPITQYSAGVLALGQTLNIDEAKQDLGYKPVLSIADGFHRFAAWYQQ